MHVRDQAGLRDINSYDFITSSNVTSTANPAYKDRSNICTMQDRVRVYSVTDYCLLTRITAEMQKPVREGL